MTGFCICVGCNYERVLHIPGFRVCQDFVHKSVAQGPKYARAQNMARLRICKGYTGC